MGGFIMELGHVATNSMVGMAIAALIAFVVPIGLLIWNRKKNRATISSFFIGCGVFVVAALVLEQIFHFIVLTLTGDTITGNIWLYGLYGGLAAAVFEETGRFLAMKFFLKNQFEEKNAFMYGIGHGGIEAMMLVGFSNISNIMTSAMVNSGAMEASLAMLDEATATTTVENISALWELPSYQFYLGGVERLFAIALQIAFSILMYQAVKQQKKSLIATAFAVHFLVDFVTVVTANYLNLGLVEVLVGLMTVGVVFVAWKTRKN